MVIMTSSNQKDIPLFQGVSVIAKQNLAHIILNGIITYAGTEGLILYTYNRKEHYFRYEYIIDIIPLDDENKEKM
jgi:hypothetical protein